ncbi:hypothetical protein [Pseudomonas poae]|uniref:hypothetical protein n=1 Tax=Pseudomonas poae TaxID=200451 RepID=UPI001645CF73|nr:hypothetical protein [Pseudomonas poae]MBC3196976.1 hypothetical protein [Pseudomonas poae]
MSEVERYWIDPSRLVQEGWHQDDTCVVKDWAYDRVVAERDALQQRLTAADEREDVLKGQVSMLLRELQELINDEDGILVAAELSTGFAWHSLQKHGKAIKATLKAAEGRGHD